MKLKPILGVALVFLFSGCATNMNLYNLDKKVGNLESRLNSIEERQTVIETQIDQSRKPSGLLGAAGERDLSDKIALTKKEIQTALKNANFYQGPIDGVVGKETKKAIEEFQKANGLKADGIVGEKTKSLLAEYLKKE